MKMEGSREALVIIEGGALFRGKRVGVSSHSLQATEIAILRIRPGEPSEERTVVRAIPRPEVAPGCVVIGADLALELGVEAVGSMHWSLTTEGFEPRRLSEVAIELAVERPLEQVVEELSRCPELGELLLYLPRDQDLSAMPLEIGDLPFRILKAEPRPSAQLSVLEVDGSTRIQVFAPGGKSGVDMVILADCSGSMDTADLTDTVEQVGAKGLFQRFVGAGTPSLRRDEAQRRALKRLLDLRLRLAGRVSRIALVGFNDRCVQRFPRGGGMREMDESASPEIVQEFRDAIGLLQAESAGTDIGQALHFAAELLVRDGHPANDRLIVLVSDGAHWTPKGDEATGEETIALKEPISLTAHLNRDLKINLHALGIGTEATFRQWFAAQPGKRGVEPHVGLIPNHALLEELVRVGGGDPSRVGDADVLETYFSGLGAGVTRHVVPPKREATPSPNAHELAEITRAAATAGNQTVSAMHNKVDILVEEILSLYQTCNDYSARERDRPAFKMTPGSLKSLSLGIRKKVGSPEDFRNFVIATHQTFYEARDIDGKTGSEGSIEERLNDSRLRDLNAVRVAYAHDLLLDKKTNNLLRAGEAFRRWVGVSHIEDDDVSKWAAVQAAILTDVRDVLAGLRDMYRDPDRRPPPKPKPPSGFVWKD